MTTKTEIEAFEAKLDTLLSDFKEMVMTEVEKLGIKKPDTFLQELSEPVKLAEDEIESTQETPDMNGIEMPEKEPELPFLKRGSGGWKELVKHLMTREIKELPQVGKKFQLTAKDYQYLKDLIYFKAELFSGNMDANQINAQGVDNEDNHWFIEMQQTKESLK